MARALAETEDLCRRPRLLRTEFWYAWIRALVFSKPEPWGRLDARDRLGASDRAIGRALAPAPAAPPLTEERFRKILADNLEIAERSGNRAAVELLRRQLKRLRRAAGDTRHFSNTVRAGKIVRPSRHRADSV